MTPRDETSQTRRRIGLYGPFGWGNLGDAAIQEAMLHNLRLRLPAAEFVGFSLNPANTEAIHGIPAVAIEGLRRTVGHGFLGRGLGILRDIVRELRSSLAVIARLRRFDDFVISGGGQISDDWGGPWDHPYSLLKWMLCARLAGCRVLVVSVGAGPFRNPRSESLFCLALRLAEYRSYRTEGSKQLLASSSFTHGDRVYPDLAFSLPCAVVARSDAKSVIGISPLCWFYPKPGPWPEQDGERYKEHLATVLGFSLELLRRGHRVVLFCSQIRNDRFAFDDLLAELQRHGIEADGVRLIAEPTQSLAMLLEQIAQCDIVLSSRLHGVILSYLQHKPVLSLSYDPKIDAVMEQFGQSSYCLPIEDTDLSALLASFDRLQSGLGPQRQRIRTTADSHRRELDAQYDRLFGRSAQTSAPAERP